MIMITQNTLTAMEQWNTPYNEITCINEVFNSSFFWKCKFWSASFINCELRQATFRGSIFKNVIFKNCDLTNVDFSLAKFQRTQFIECNLEGCDFTNVQIFEFCDNIACFNVSKEIQVLFEKNKKI